MVAHRCKTRSIARVAGLAIFVSVSCADDPAVGEGPPVLEPGEICDTDNRPELRLLFRES